MDLESLLSRDGVVQRTQLGRKLTIDGITKSYPVYKIRLDQLRYNPQNDRIATYISQYKADHNGMLPDEDDVEAYNAIIEEFIVNSNPERINQTKNNIRLFGQRQPGVVLNNGLLIDGNRRFTCLRQLAEEDSSFNWIEAVILGDEVAADAKAIKILELSIQHGEEEKVDYNPIDRLVGVYNDIVHNHLLTETEYANSSNIPVKDIQNMVKQARYMTEFLEFINAEGQFHIARELEIAGQLAEMPGIMRACKDPEQEETVKSCVYANIVMEPAGDLTRHVRKFKKILKSDIADSFVDEQAALAFEVAEKLQSVEKMSTKAIRETVRTDEELVKRMADSMADAEMSARKVQILATPVDNIRNARELLEEVDDAIIRHIGPDEAGKAVQMLNAIQDRIDQLREIVETIEE